MGLGVEIPSPEVVVVAKVVDGALVIVPEEEEVEVALAVELEEDEVFDS